MNMPVIENQEREKDVEILVGAGGLSPLQWPRGVSDIVRLLQVDSNRLKVYRVALGLEQHEIAAKFGVSLRTWGSWERGVVRVSADVLVQIARGIKACLGQ